VQGQRKVEFSKKREKKLNLNPTEKKEKPPVRVKRHSFPFHPILMEWERGGRGKKKRGKREILSKSESEVKASIGLLTKKPLIILKISLSSAISEKKKESGPLTNCTTFCIRRKKRRRELFIFHPYGGEEKRGGKTSLS